MRMLRLPLDKARASQPGVRLGRDLGIGWFAIIGGLALGVFAFAQGSGAGSVRVCLACWMFAWVAWVVLVRPQVVVIEDRVLLVGSLRDVFIPAGRVTDVDLGAYLRITVGGNTYTSAAAGAPRGRQRGDARGSGRPAVVVDGPFIAQCIRTAAEHALRVGSVSGSVVDRWAILPLVTLLGLCVAVAATFAL